MNTARAFVVDEAFNLILGEVHGQYRKKNVYGQWSEDFSELRPAARAKSAPHDWTVAPSSNVTFASGAGGSARDDWLVFDAGQLAALATPPEAPAAAGAARAAPPAVAPAPAAPAPGGAVPPPPAPATSAEADMERRLRTLKDLHEKGLITEEAYRAKIEEILSVL